MVIINYFKTTIKTFQLVSAACVLAACMTLSNAGAVASYGGYGAYGADYYVSL
jgi:hypothetical protein